VPFVAAEIACSRNGVKRANDTPSKFSALKSKKHVLIFLKNSCFDLPVTWLCDLKMVSAVSC